MNADRVRQLLAEERAETSRQIASLSDDFAAIVDATQGVATDDEHDPEGATIAFERAATAALLDQARDHLAEVDRALERLAAGSYGCCERCGQAIGADRLQARPIARTCIRCASRPRVDGR